MRLQQRVLQGDIDARAGVVGRLLVSTSALENILPSRKEREKDGPPVPAGHGGGCPYVIPARIRDLVALCEDGIHKQFQLDSPVSCA